jgi:two-component system, chemotaxis family, protein-glutamate methylesterase/glutaminase
VPTVIVIGASDAGVPVIRDLLGALPAGFPAVICVVVHTSRWRTQALVTALTVDGRVPIEPVNHQMLTPGRVYVAPADHHLLLNQDEVLVWHGPKEDSHRPAVNALFRSAAVAYGAQVVGVVLSGTVQDGTTGLWWIKRYGGVTVVQDPRDQPELMPSALDGIDVDYCVPARDLPRLLVQLATGDATEGAIQ